MHQHKKKVGGIRAGANYEAWLFEITGSPIASSFHKDVSIGASVSLPQLWVWLKSGPAKIIPDRQSGAYRRRSVLSAVVYPRLHLSTGRNEAGPPGNQR